MYSCHVVTRYFIVYILCTWKIVALKMTKCFEFFELWNLVIAVKKSLHDNSMGNEVAVIKKHGKNEVPPSTAAMLELSRIV